MRNCRSDAVSLGILGQPFYPRLEQRHWRACLEGRHSGDHLGSGSRQKSEEAKAQLIQLNAAVRQAHANVDLGEVMDRELRWRSPRVVQLGPTRHRSPGRCCARRRARLGGGQREGVAGGGQSFDGTHRVRQFKAPFDGVVATRDVDVGISSTPAARRARLCLRSRTFIGCAYM